MTVPTVAPSSSLTPLQTQTLTFLTSLGFRLSADWFAYASQEIIREHNAAAASTANTLTPETLGRAVYTQILFLPLHLVSLPALPRLPQRVSSYHNTTLNGTFILQVHRVKLVSVKQADRNDGDYTYHQRDHRQHRMSHLICGDGFTCVAAIELVKCAVIPDIEQPPPFVMTETTVKTITSVDEVSAAPLSAPWVGYKIAVRDVEVRHGVLLLTPSNVQMLGGQLDSKIILPAVHALSQVPTISDQKEMDHADEIDQLYEYVTEDEGYTHNTSAINMPALSPSSAQYALPQTVANRVTTRPPSLTHIPTSATTNTSRLNLPMSSTPPIQRVPEPIASRSSSNGVSSSYSKAPVSLVRPIPIVTAASTTVDDDIDAFELNLSPPISSQRDDLYSPPPPLEEDDELIDNQMAVEVNNNFNDNENINPTTMLQETDDAAFLQSTQSAQDFYNNYDNTLAARTSRAHRYRSTIKNEQHLSTIVEERSEAASPQPQLSSAASTVTNNETTALTSYGRNNPIPMPFTRASTLLTPQTEMSVAAAAAAPAGFKYEVNVTAPTSDAALQTFIEYSVAEQLSQPNISAEELEIQRAAQNEIDEIIIIDSDTDGEQSETDDPDIIVTSSVLSSQPSPSESQAAAQQEIAQMMSASSPILCRLAMLNEYRRGITDTTIVVTNGITIHLQSCILTPLYQLLLWIDDGTQCILVCLHRAMVTHMFGCSESYHLTHTTGAEERRLRVEKALSAMSGVMSILLVPSNKLSTKDHELYGDYPILLHVRPVDKDYLTLLQRTLSSTTTK